MKWSIALPLQWIASSNSLANGAWFLGARRLMCLPLMPLRPNILLRSKAILDPLRPQVMPLQSRMFGSNLEPLQTKHSSRARYCRRNCASTAATTTANVRYAGAETATGPIFTPVQSDLSWCRGSSNVPAAWHQDFIRKRVMQVPGSPPNPTDPANPMGVDVHPANMAMAQALLTQQAKEQTFSSPKAGNRPSFPGLRAKAKLKMVR